MNEFCLYQYIEVISTYGGIETIHIRILCSRNYE